MESDAQQNKESKLMLIPNSSIAQGQEKIIIDFNNVNRGMTISNRINKKDNLSVDDGGPSIPDENFEPHQAIITLPDDLQQTKPFIQTPVAVNQRLTQSQRNRQSKMMKEQTPKFSLNIALIIQKFLYKLKINTSFWSQQMLKDTEFEMLNDLASDTQEIYYNKINKIDVSKPQDIIFDKIHHFFDQIPHMNTITPDNYYLYFWDVLHLIIIQLCIFYIPLELATGLYFRNMYIDNWIAFIIFALIVYCIDIYLNFHTSYYKNGFLELDRKKVAKHYLTNGFIMDVLSTLPLIEGLTSFAQFKFLNLFILFKLFTITDIFNKYRDLFLSKKYRTAPGILKLFRLLLTIMFLAHLFSCLFLGLANLIDYYELADNTWIKKYKPDLIESSWFTQYIYSFYWSSTTMITVGYGDITPSNTYEVGLITIAMYVACWMVSYSFSFIGIVIGEINKRDDEFEEQMKLVNRYLDFKNINQDLKMKVTHNLKHRFEAENELTSEEEQKILKLLPDGIKEQVIMAANLPYLTSVPFFSHNFSKSFLIKLALSLETHTYIDDEIIFSQNDLYDSDADNQIYIIYKGAVQIYTGNKKDESQDGNGQSNKQKTLQEVLHKKTINVEKDEDSQYSKYKKENFCEIKQLGEKEMFGEFGFITKYKRTAFAKSKGITYILQINRQDFLNLLKLFPRDHEKFSMIKDHCSINQNFLDLNIKCYSCGKIGHYSKQCNKMHFIPDKEKIILKERLISPQQMNRLKFETLRRVKKRNYIKKLYDLQEGIEAIKEEEGFSSDESSQQQREEEEEEEEEENKEEILNNSSNSNQQQSIQEPANEEKEDISEILQNKNSERKTNEGSIYNNNTDAKIENLQQRKQNNQNILQADQALVQDEEELQLKQQQQKVLVPQLKSNTFNKTPSVAKNQLEQDYYQQQKQVKKQLNFLKKVEKEKFQQQQQQQQQQQITQKQRQIERINSLKQGFSSHLKKYLNQNLSTDNTQDIQQQHLQEGNINVSLIQQQMNQHSIQQQLIKNITSPNKPYHRKNQKIDQQQLALFQMNSPNLLLSKTPQIDKKQKQIMSQKNQEVQLQTIDTARKMIRNRMFNPDDPSKNLTKMYQQQFYMQDLTQIDVAFPSNNTDKLQEFQMYYPKFNISAVIDRLYIKPRLPRNKQYHLYARYINENIKRKPLRFQPQSKIVKTTDEKNEIQQSVIKI